MSILKVNTLALIYRLVLGAFCLLLAVAVRAQDVSSDPLAEMLAAAPSSLEDLQPDRIAALEETATRLEAWAAEQPLPQDRPDVQLATVKRLIDVKRQVDTRRDAVLAIRVPLVELPEGESRGETIRHYLQAASRMNDLAGRLRHLLHDVLGTVVYYLGPQSPHFRPLIEMLLEERVEMGAVVMAYMLFDPAPETGLRALSVDEKYTILNLISSTGQWQLLSVLSEYLQAEKNPALVVITAILIRRLGLPQQPRPGRDPTLPAPPITADSLRKILQAIDARKLPEHLVAHRQELLEWLEQRSQHGITGDSYRLGGMELREGDWLLMRNPSPFNLFTDLSPGLFTHVGVVTTEQGADRIRRFVLVDIPEAGVRIPATIVDTYLLRTLHFVFLRHRDPAAARAMGQAARDMIGNESQFDLKFDTNRVLAMRGQPLRGAHIHTYCAGLLLLCAMQTERPLEEFFPIHERVAAGNTASNLQRMGMAIGDDFFSPTGALLSPAMQIVAEPEPMYDPGREVQEAIYNEFARCMKHGVLTPSPDAYQLLRQKLAAMSTDTPWLKRALARVNSISEQQDLEAAARAAAVIETLDDIAEENLNGFAEARQAIMTGPLDAAQAAQVEAEQRQRTDRYLQRHADLVSRWSEGRLTPRQLRAELVKFYVQRGEQQINDRFFVE